MRIVIIEDEQAAANHLKYLLTQIDSEHEVVCVIETVSEAIAWFMNNNTSDLIFSDIQLADGISFEIYEQVNVQTPIVFTTAFDEYAIRAFKLNSIDYILKPIDVDMLMFAIEKCKKQQLARQEELQKFINQQQFLPKNYRKSFLLKYKNKLLPIKITEFAYFFIENGLVFGQLLDNRKLVLEFKLEDLEKQLDPEKFIRANRQFILSRESIKFVEPHFNSRIIIQTIPTAPFEIVISKEKVKSFKKWLEES